MNVYGKGFYIGMIDIIYLKAARSVSPGLFLSICVSSSQKHFNPDGLLASH